MAHEIHENDGVLCVGEKPWHGLGVTLDSPPESAAKALRLAKMDWSVSRHPIFMEGGRPVVISGAASAKRNGSYGVILRDDTNDILGVVGPNYTPLQNTDMGKILDPIIQDGSVSIETCGSLFNGRRVWMLCRFGEALEIEKGDAVGQFILLAHGHDGAMAVRFGLTPIRVVCNNTLSMAVDKKSESKLVKCLHTSSLESNLETLRDGLVRAGELFQLTAEEYRKLALRGVSRTDLREYVRIIVDANKDESKWTGQQQTKIGTIIGMALEGRGNSGRNWWQAYNGVTEYYNWGQGRKLDNRMDSVWFGSSAEKSREALDLALQMSA